MGRARFLAYYAFVKNIYQLDSLNAITIKGPPDQATQTVPELKYLTVLDSVLICSVNDDVQTWLIEAAM